MFFFQPSNLHLPNVSPATSDRELSHGDVSTNSQLLSYTCLFHNEPNICIVVMSF